MTQTSGRIFDDLAKMMTNAAGQRVLTYAVREPTPLAGTTWQLTGYSNGQDAFVSVLVGTEITAVFDADGGLSGSAGCNNYRSSYQTEANAIAIGPVATTRMMCGNPDGVMEQESAYLAALESAVAYRIQGDRLEMIDAEGVRMVACVTEARTKSGLSE